MRFSLRNIVVVLLVFIGFLTFTGAFFIVNETKQAIVLQFGDPRKVITEPGLQFKIPFIQDAVFLDSRLLNLDPQPEEMILSDQKRIIVDSFARYKIVNPLKFFQTVRNEATFSDRFGRIINAAVRGTIAQYSLSSLLSEDRSKIMSSIQATVKNEEGELIVLARNGEIAILNEKGREIDKFDIPAGAILKVTENDKVKQGTVLVQWDPHSIPILSEVAGKVRYEDVVDGETLRVEKETKRGKNASRG